MSSPSSSAPAGTIPGDPHGSFEARPLAAPGAAVQGGRSGASITRLGFALPTDERAYDRLAAADRAKLGTALASVDCSEPGIDTARTRVVCTQEAGSTALLTGPPVLTAADIASTRAVPPGNGIVQWTIEITLSAAGRTALASYTSAHHADQSQTASPTACSSAATPCADFLALITRGVSVSVPVTVAPITNGVIEVAGPYTATSATALARQLAS